MDKSRQQFEEWFNENGFSLGWCSKRDLEVIKNKMNKCWQASRESLEVEFPDPTDTEYSPDYYTGYHEAICDTREKLISYGVKIKNE